MPYYLPPAAEVWHLVIEGLPTTSWQSAIFVSNCTRSWSLGWLMTDWPSAHLEDMILFEGSISYVVVSWYYANNSIHLSQMKTWMTRLNIVRVVILLHMWYCSASPSISKTKIADDTIIEVRSGISLRYQLSFFALSSRGRWDSSPSLDQHLEPLYLPWLLDHRRPEGWDERAIFGGVEFFWLSVRQK